MQYDILFLGRLFPRQYEKEIKSKMKSGMQDAANALQWNVIDGLDENSCGTIKILDYLPVDSYPNGYTEKHIDERVFQHTDKYISADKIVGCTNITVLKQFANLPFFKKEVKKWAFDGNKQKKILLMYTASALFLQLAKFVKKLNPDILTCCIIADLPEFSSARELHGIRKAYNRYLTEKSNRLYRNIDKFVLLTDQMAKRLNIKVPYMVMEGIAPEADRLTDDFYAGKFKNDTYILYSGTLNYEFGIDTLLKAFSMVRNTGVKLIICGFGEAEESIKNSDDNRIVFLGKIERSQVLALQRSAAVLVNPRQNNHEFTKYSFPSKTMEYLSSGVPVVAYKLDGIPNEYDEYINYVPDNTPESLAKLLERFCSLSAEERQIIGKKASDFVLNEKNRVKQTKRISDFFDW